MRKQIAQISKMMQMLCISQCNLSREGAQFCQPFGNGAPRGLHFHMAKSHKAFKTLGGN
jgi:hypothetical protein